MGDYLSYSASVYDLTKWRFEGVIYTRTQDPRMKDGRHCLWAPDVIRGKDGRYYLYYCPDDRIKSIGVAVCDSPAGKYEFYGIVQDKNGGYLGEREGDTIAFDPGVFIDEDGQIYLYCGNGPRTEKAIGKEPKASVVVRLNDDMVTMREEPRKLLPALGEAQGTGFEGHEFFEASSIRKINGTYYLVYSSKNLHELCCATAEKADGPYKYGGVLISNAEHFDGSQETMKNCWGNNHGGIEIINGQYYVFYHVPTNRSMYSRQGRAEKLTILPSGSIPQVHMTSRGLNDGPLPACGTYPVSCVCILHGNRPGAIAHPLAMGKRHPYITQDGPDLEIAAEGEDTKTPRQFITNGRAGLIAGFRYFEVKEPAGISVTLRGNMKGFLEVRLSEGGASVGVIEVSPSKVHGWSGKGKVKAFKESLRFLNEQVNAWLLPEKGGVVIMAYSSIRPGKEWLDTEKNPIQAHGFSVFYDEKEACWYWYGENKEKTKKGGTIWHWGVNLYRSKDLYNWEKKGLIIPPEPDDLLSPLHPTCCMDRPHILYCEKTGTTFNSQITCVICLPGTDRYIALADRWMPQWYIPKMAKSIVAGTAKHFADYEPDTAPKEAVPLPGELQKHSENTYKSRYVWLPIEWEGEKPVIRWIDEWRV